MRIKSFVCYRGTRYLGFQIQAPSEEKSIQGEIQRVLSQIFFREIKIVGSGRTDKGVHALKQCFHFDVAKEVDLVKLKRSANCLLPSDIHILSFERVPDDFHARFDVKDKTYRYIVNTGEYDPIEDELLYNYNRPLDVGKIAEAGNLLIGEHSFHNFCCNDDDFVRTVYAFRVWKEKEKVIMELNGNGFRRYMVRMIVGTLIEVGSGRMGADRFGEYLSETKSRVSYKAPASGLYLADIRYGGENDD